ncbi:MAG: filamentous hemagglutinin N-terminal domain-containing protein, partial [Arcobacteraceae bacterium]|nr:filamentous hemagglutinin N-terminal domain-containing protein [Arcobacteraceae bacterium]
MKRLIDFSSRFRILKGGKISLVVSALLGGATLCVASPTGGTVTSGSANIVQNGTVTNINQSTQKASINWQNFSIASNETVNFNQPNSSSITLNRVIGNERSVIDGAMNANGQVWLLNSNGVLFGKNASINTAGLLATTAQLSDTDFHNGNYNFKNATANSVINEGTITISDSGSVILASNEVRNSGTIEAIKGKVHLVGADSYSLNLNGNSLVNLKVDKGVLDALVENSGHIIADGGEIYLTTNAVNELLKGVVNNTGIIEANSLDGLTGEVILFAHGGTAEIGGTITALDGFVETSGKYFDFLGADIQAGEWLIDPVNITIGSTLASSIQSALGSGDVTISTDGGNTPSTSSGESGGVGNIYVNSNISWTSNKNLTLQAANGVSGSATINIGHTEASFTINQSGNSTFTGIISGNGSFNKLGSGALTLSGANTYKGATVVDAGTLAITNNTGLGAAFDTYGGGTFVNSGATLDLRNVAVGEETIILNGGTLATTMGNSSLAGDFLLDYGTSTFSVANGATLTINGKIRDSMKLVQELYSGYYDDKLSRDFGTQASLSLTSEIDYGTSTQYVSARWLGYFTPKESGQYTFYASSDDASLVYLGTEGQNLLDLLQRNDGISGYTTSRLLINNSGVSRETNTGTYTVNAGEVYPIIIYYGNNTSGGSIDFKYRAPSMGSSYTFDLSNEFSISPQANPTAQNITKVGNGTLIFTANNTYTGATNINEGTLKIANNAPSQATSGYHGAGQLVIAPTSNSFTNTFDTSTAGFTFGSTLGGLTIGKSTNTAAVAINSAISIAGDITLYGGNIAINQKLESTGANSTITLDGSGAITDGASGYLLASNLLLSDGAITLNNTNNDVDNIAASGVDSILFYDTDGFNLGSTIGGITGISSTGMVTLSAGADENIGTSTGGDITITGTPTITSTNSYVGLYTGSISGSTGLSSVVNAGNFRYNSDESTTNFATAIGATGTTYAIYREQPTATVTANNKTITYGDNNPIYDGTETGIVNGDDSLIAYTLTDGVTSASGYTNAGSYTIDADASALTGLGYNVTQQDDGTLIVDKAALTVTANDDAKFVTQGDNTGTFNGVSYSGFVGGETATVLGGALAINRLNSGTDTAAGIYNDVLEASGLTADNYDINYNNGDYTIVPSDQLLVRVTNVSDTYGTNTQYALTSVEYYDGSSVVTLGGGTGSTSIDANNLVTITDGAGGSATFTVSPQSATTSTAGKLEAGNYQLDVDGLVTENSVNFSDTVTIVGAHQVNQKSITASTTGGVSKVYDGTTDMSGVSLALTTLETNDVVTVDGVGSFSSKNTGTSLDYTINNVTLSGTDATNYYLSGG